MSQSINLVPQQEKLAQKKKKLLKSSTVTSIFLLLVVLLISGYFFYTTYLIKQQTLQHEANIQSLRAEIAKLSDIEIVSRNLDKKSSAVSQLFTNRVYYSTMLRELASRTPNTITIDSLSISSEGKLSLTGEGTDYIAVSGFVKSLSEAKASSASLGIKDVFNNVSLNSVNLDKQTNRVKYFIIVDVKKEVLNVK